MSKILTLTYYTKEVPLMNKGLVREEIKAQGVDNLIFHLTYADYFVFAVSIDDGRVIEVQKKDGNYCLRDNFDKTHNWQMPSEGEICNLIRKYLNNIFN